MYKKPTYEELVSRVRELEENEAKRILTMKNLGEKAKNVCLKTGETPIGDQLKWSQYILQTILDAIPSSVFWKNSDLRYLGGNKAFMESAGIDSEEDIVGKNDYDLPWLPEQADTFRKDDKEVMESGIAKYNIVETYPRPNGTHGWVRTNKVPLVDGAGDVVGILGTAEEITDLKQQEEILKQTAQRLTHAHRIGKIGFLEWSIKTDRMYWSDEIYHLYGIDPQVIPTIDHLWHLVHPEDLEYVKKNYELAVRSEKEYDIDHRIIRDDNGNVIWIHAHAKMEIDDNGDLENISATVVDITERKQAEVNLRESKEQLTKFMDSATDGFILFDSELTHVEMNKVALELTGQKREDVIGKRLIDTVPGVRESGRYDQYKNVIDTGNPFHINDLTPHPLTGEKHIELNAFKVGDGLGIIFTDITDRKLAEDNLAKSHEAMKNQNKVFTVINRLFQESIVCNTSAEVAQLCLTIAEDVTGSKYGSVAEVNRSHRFDTLALSNPGWEECRMAKLNPTLIHDMEIRGIWSAALGHEHGVIINDPSIHPLSVGTPDGHPPLKAFLGMPFHHTNFNGMIGLAKTEGVYTEIDREIIEALALSFAEVINSKRSEEALRVSENKYRLSMEATTDGIWDWNLQTNEVYYSPSWGKLIGEITVNPRRSTWISRIHPTEKDEVLLTLQKHQRGESEFWHKEHRLKTKTGQWKWVLGRGRVVQKDDNGEPLRMVGTMTDITQLKQVQTQLQQAQKLESIGNLAGGIAHDFNNILSAIIGFTELALDDVQAGSNIENNLQEVYSAGNRAKDLVRQILTFARQTDDELKPIQVDIILKEVLHFLRSSIPTTIEIDQNINSDSLIMGNATKVHQVLMNLCTNASHAMVDGGILSISLDDVSVDKTDRLKDKDLKQGDYIEIKVSDTGVGIPPEIIGSIFEPYFTTKGVGEGTGMGLSVVHGIVESYYGKILVDSTLGEGAEFTIYLPITKRRRSDRSYQSERLPKGNERILFVDDEAPIAKIGSHILTKLGYTVTTRTSSIEALELFRSKPENFDLLISDMTMPNMTGDRLAIEFMKIRPGLPVILCTGYSKKISDDMAMEIGIKAFAYKPIVKADLAKTIRKVLDEATQNYQA